MSTRSAIARQNPDSSVDVIYCHWDGYLTGVGLELVGHYSTKAKLDRLIKLGNISTLEDTLEATKEQCGGSYFPAEHYESLAKLQESLVDSMIEYLYVGSPSTCQADVWLPDIEWHAYHRYTNFTKAVFLPNPYILYTKLEDLITKEV